MSDNHSCRCFQDNESESSQPSSEGSSASSTFCTLEKDYARVRVLQKLIVCKSHKKKFFLFIFT